MARQASQAKLLYYPTANPVVELIATWYSNPTRSRLADPCVGQGEALALFKDRVGGEAETWGVELSFSRAEMAKHVIDVVLPESFYHVRWQDSSVSFVLDNPPYDYSEYTDARGKKIRHERLFITRMTGKLIAGGQHAIIVGRSQLLDEELARHIMGWYERVLVFGYPDSEFDQVIVLAQKQAKYHPATKRQIEGLMAWGDPDVQLTPICPCPGDHRRYVIPPAPSGARTFAYTPTTYSGTLDAAVLCSPLSTLEWKAATFVRPLGAPVSPLVPAKVGHLAMRLSSGDVGELLIQTDEGPALAKGSLSKKVTQTCKDNEDDDSVHVEGRESLATCVTLTRPNGDILTLTTSQAIGDFMTKYADVLATTLIQRDVPLYDFHPTAHEWTVAKKVAIAMPTLPGRKERGLFDVQGHFAVAASRGMLERKHIVINADMGFGKTLTAIATLEERDLWPALVMVPGHMVEKWRRDLERGSNPEEPIVARIVDTGARPAVDVVSRLGKLKGSRILSDTRAGNRRELVIRSSKQAATNVVNYARDNWLDPITSGGVSEVEARKDDLAAFIESTEDNADHNDTGEAGLTWTLNILDSSTGSHYLNVVRPMVAGFGGEIVSMHRKQVSPKPGCDGRVRALAVRIPDANLNPLLFEMKRRGLKPVLTTRLGQANTGVHELDIADKDTYTMVEFVEDYAAGRLGGRAAAIVSYDSAKNDAGLDGLTYRAAERTVWDEDEGEHMRKTVYLCPDCGGPLTEESIEAGFCQNAVTEFVFDETGKVQRDGNGEQIRRERKCGCALRPMTRWRRVAISRLVRDQYKHFFKTYVCDEVHGAL